MRARKPERMAVAVPVTDLRKKPVARRGGGQDLLQESQLLLGEDVRVLARRGPWAKVECLNQLTFESGQWRPYPGWVRSEHLVVSAEAPRWNAMVKRAVARIKLNGAPSPALRASSPVGRGRTLTLSLGTGVRVLEPSGPRTLRVALAAGLTGHIRRGDVRFIGIRRGDAEMRERVLKSARQFLGEPYLWGGKSSARLGKGSGVDCSGLVALSFNATGAYNFPRNARDQFARARRIQRAELKPADLVFLSAEGAPTTIVHVMLYAGNGRVIEAAGRAAGVRRIALAKRFGVPFDRIEDGSAIGGRTVYFGALL